MVIGCMGDIVFQVSDDAVLTVTNFIESASAKYAVHQRHNGNAETEFVGLDPDKITFDMVLSAWLGVEPQGQINKLWGYIRNGTSFNLVLGSICYGKQRWTLENFQIKQKQTDGRGTWMNVTVSVSLLEYMDY